MVGSRSMQCQSLFACSEQEDRARQENKTSRETSISPASSDQFFSSVQLQYQILPLLLQFISIKSLNRKTQTVNLFCIVHRTHFANHSHFYLAAISHFSLNFIGDVKRENFCLL